MFPLPDRLGRAAEDAGCVLAGVPVAFAPRDQHGRELRGSRRARSGFVRLSVGVFRFHPNFMPAVPRAVKSLSLAKFYAICAGQARLARKMSLKFCANGVPFFT